MASLAVVQIGVQFLRERRPACDGFAGERGLSRVLFLAADAACAGPRGRWLYSNCAALHDEHAASLPRDVVGDGDADNSATNDSATNDQHLNRLCGMRHTVATCFQDIQCSSTDASLHCLLLRRLSAILLNKDTRHIGTASRGRWRWACVMPSGSRRSRRQ